MAEGEEALPVRRAQVRRKEVVPLLLHRRLVHLRRNLINNNILLNKDQDQDKATSQPANGARPVEEGVGITRNHLKLVLAVVVMPNNVVILPVLLPVLPLALVPVRAPATEEVETAAVLVALDFLQRAGSVLPGLATEMEMEIKDEIDLLLGRLDREGMEDTLRDITILSNNNHHHHIRSNSSSRQGSNNRDTHMDTVPGMDKGRLIQRRGVNRNNTNLTTLPRTFVTIPTPDLILWPVWHGKSCLCLPLM